MKMTVFVYLFFCVFFSQNRTLHMQIAECNWHFAVSTINSDNDTIYVPNYWNSVDIARLFTNRWEIQTNVCLILKMRKFFSVQKVREFQREPSVKCGCYLMCLQGSTQRGIEGGPKKPGTLLKNKLISDTIFMLPWQPRFCFTQ